MLRVLAVLAALTVVGGVLRFHAASDPSAYQSKDEQSYAMIARGLSVTGNYGNPGMTDPVHWPPGAPLMFALAYELKPQKRGGGVWDVPSAYPAQALVGTLTIPAAFLLAYLVAGWGAGLLAAAAVAFYPPLISASGDLLSEPLGALLVTSALAATVWALRRPASWLPPIAAGLLLGATILTRADLARPRDRAGRRRRRRVAARAVAAARGGRARRGADARRAARDPDAVDGVRVVEGRALRAALQRRRVEPLGRDVPPGQRLDVRGQARAGRRGARPQPRSRRQEVVPAAARPTSSRRWPPATPISRPTLRCRRRGCRT